MDDNKIYITDDNGKEVEMNILFTFDANNKNYVICYEGENDDDVYPFTYDENGNLYIVEDDEELKMIQEVVEAFDGDEDAENN